MIGHQAALVYTMVLVAAADGDLNDAEMAQMGNLVQTLPCFKGFNSDDLTYAMEECVQFLAEEEDQGLEKALEKVRNALPARLRETAYLIACEVAACDRLLVQEELRLLEMIRHTLDIDRLHSAAIERGIRARFAV